MIVRNEAPVIRRCLESVRPVIDSWIVVDTGSTDGTQDIVRASLQDIPGELIERPWVNFGHNRSEALDLARGRATYMLVIDADEVLEATEAFQKGRMTADAYLVEAHYGCMSYQRKQILRSSLPWRYVGVVHEYAFCEQSQVEEPATGLRTHVHHDGARALDPKTYRRDALLLESALLDEPDSPRNVFYLAQSYRDAADFESAARHYQRRIELGGWREEVWYSHYQIARLLERMARSWGDVLQAYLQAYQFEPQRAEPLYYIGMHYLRCGDFALARLFFDQALTIAFPSPDRLFVEKDIYHFATALELATACGALGAHQEAIAHCNSLLRGGLLPPEQRTRALQIRSASVQARVPPPEPNDAKPRIVFCVPMHDPGPELDDCVESLLLQNAVFETCFVDDGSTSDCAARLPLENPGSSLLRNQSPQGVSASVALVAALCGPNDILVPIAVAERLAVQNVGQRLQALFRDRGCQLVYGQHRLASGNLGTAEPAASSQDLIARGAALVSGSLIAFRASLWQKLYPALVGRLASHQSGGGDTKRLPEVMINALMQEAGFDGSRFVDDVFTVHALDHSDPRLTPYAKHRHSTNPEGTSNEARSNLEKSSGYSLPKVSCLMVTHDRLALAKRSIRCYAAQDYPHRELVIVSDGAQRVRDGLARFVAELGLHDVRFVFPEQTGLSLGQLRNIAMDAAQGEAICQWDDDDCYHPNRIRLQMDHMLRNGAQACCLTDHLQYLDEDRALVWVDWTLGGKSGKDQLLPGTIVMFKDDRFLYPESGPFSQRGEDSIFLFDVFDNASVVGAKGLGYLYLYNYHGRNTFNREHHYRMSLFSRSAGELERAKGVIREAMAHYPVAKPYLVVGRDGPAYMLDD